MPLSFCCSLKDLLLELARDQFESSEASFALAAKAIADAVAANNELPPFTFKELEKEDTISVAETNCPTKPMLPTSADAATTSLVNNTLADASLAPSLSNGDMQAKKASAFACFARSMRITIKDSNPGW